MRKIYFAFAAIAAVMMVSCTKEIANEIIEDNNAAVEEGKVSMTFLASAEDATKVALDVDGKTAKWEGGETIAVYDGVSATANIFTANSAGTTTSFTGTVSGGATNFVAVYPASAAVALGDGDKPISAVIPEVQEATLNSFDPAAALYVAESTDLEAKFAFKAAFALLKVNVDVDNVVAVTVENTKNNFAGSVNVNTSAGVANGSGVTYKKVTLKKGDGSALTKGTYYIVVRHLGTTSVYQNFTLSYITSDAVLGERSSANDIDNSKLGRKCVLSIGSLSAVPAEKSWYAYYQAGYDVTVGSKTINVATNGDATLWTADNDVYEVPKTTTEAGGVFFFKAVGTGTFNNASNPTIATSVYFVSDKDERVNFSLANVYNLADDAVFCLKGFDVTMTGGKSSCFSVNKNSSKSSSNLIIDNCKFTLNSTTKYVLATNSSFSGYGVKNIEMVNSHFAVAAAANLVNVTKTFAGIAEYQSMTFTNNYVYSTTGANLATSIFAFSPDSALDDIGTTMYVTISNNLFYNTVAAGTFKHNTLASATATKNVYSTVDASGLGSNAKMFGMKKKEAIPSVSVTDNVGYGPLADGKKWTIADSTINTGMDNIVTAPSDPVASANVTTGTFTMASGYESYGPQAL